MLRKPPLPFRGSKNLWFKEFQELIASIEGEEELLFVDVFGGSGLLSYWIKQIKPRSTVIYNDFDNYKERIEHVKDTEDLRKIIYPLIDKNKKGRNDALPAAVVEQIKQILSEAVFVDVPTWSSWLCFSARKCNSKEELLLEKKYYPRVPKFPLDVEHIKQYLNGISIVCFDASEPEQFINNLKLDLKKKIYYVLDPPYLYTETSSYSSNIAKEWFDLQASVKLFYYFIHHLNVILFSSEKSGLIETYNTFCCLYDKPEDVIDTTNIIYKLTPGGCKAYQQQEFMLSAIEQ